MIVLLEKHKWARCILFLTVLPGLFTYLTLTNWLKANECWSLSPIDNSAAASPATVSSGILHCQNNRIILLPPESNPSIVRLTQRMTREDAVTAMLHPDTAYMEKVWLYSAPHKEEQEDEAFHNIDPKSESSTAVNKYGFRSNKNKGKSQQQKKTFQIPFATYLLGAMNIGLYWAYWNYRVDPSRVVHNALISEDYGRAFTSTFGHFEIWHLGINMMTLFSLGAILEQQVYGSIPFLMYTISFVPLTAIVVVLLQRLSKTQNSMVGFSGILFCWSVVATLSSSQSCPIFFLPDVCFRTYHVWGVSVSLGPLVQLVFLQVVLPRVSFVGHLSGIVVGFFWHWKLLPPLEWLQPCILFPILWSIGKLVFPRLFPLSVASRGGISGGYTVGGGAAAAAAGSSSSNGGGGGGFEAGVTALMWMRNLLIVHCCILTYCIGVWNSSRSSIIISEVLLVLVLTFTANARKSSSGGMDTTTVFSDWAMMGRGYVIFVSVTLLTDGMTIMGWWLVSQSITGLVAFCMILRWILLYSSLCMICHMLRYYGVASTQVSNVV
ncbi:MAG: hypothetical protein SGBAC_004436 [Bacillariaceae sp.]